MVDDSYTLDKPGPPSRAKQWFDQAAVPAAIQAAGTLEAVVERAAQATRRQPAAGLALAAAVGWMARLLIRRRRA